MDNFQLLTLPPLKISSFQRLQNLFFGICKTGLEFTRKRIENDNGESDKIFSLF